MTHHPTVTAAEAAVEFDVAAEFDRQVQTLVDAGYPAMAGLTDTAFGKLLAPLEPIVLDRVSTGEPMRSPTPSRVPFVLVISTTLAPADQVMRLTALGSKPGFADFDPDDLSRFEPIDAVRIPADQAYVVFDVDRGPDTLNITPDDAIVTITERGRTPITVAEGIALITTYPAALEKNNCFHTAASRRADQRVPALWISEGAPKLGWCWARNRHTWLGVASCGGRAGAS